MKKILIFSVDAGGGHICATQAIQDYLQKNYKITVFNLFRDVIPWADPIQIATFGRCSLEAWYNFFIRKKYNHLANFTGALGVFAYPLLSPFIKMMMINRITKESPDIIISVVPIINEAIGSVAEKLNIPFIIVPTDLDTRWFRKYLSGKSYKNLIFTLSFDDSMIWKKLKNTDFAKNKIKVTGFPIKKSFFEPKDKNAIKNEFNIPGKKPVLMMLMGANGSDAIIDYLQEIKNVAISLHIIICLGKNEQLRKNIEQILFPKSISFSIIGFTNKIADLMAISDILLSKSGSVSVCEALYMGLPVILDNISISLDWERFNIDFIKNHKFGDVITEYNQVVPLVKKYCSDNEYRLQIKNNIERFQKYYFGKNIVKIVNELLDQ